MNRAAKKIGAMLAAAALALSLHAQEAETVQVVGRGCGTDKTEALKDAYRDAVERAVGLYVDAEQMVKNAQLVKDKILTQSNAYIESYELVEEEAKPNGLTEVKILADVKTKALTARINDAMPTRTYSLGKEDLSNVHARMATTERRNVDGAALLAKALEGFDPCRLSIDCTLASNVPAVREKQDNAIPKGSVAAYYLLKTEINPERFFEQVVPRLRDVLEQISVMQPLTVKLPVSPQNDVDVAALVKKGQSRAAGDGALQYEGKSVTASIPLPKIRREQVGNLPDYLDYHNYGSRKTFVLLVTGVNKLGTVYHASVYALDEASSKVMSDWERLYYGVNARIKPPTFEASLLDAGGDILQCSFFNSGRDACFARASEPKMICLVPWLLHGGGTATQTSYHWQKFTLPKDALPEIANLKIEIVK